MWKKLLENHQVILASTSPRRQEIIKGLGIEFKVVPSLFPEDLDKSQFEFPQDYVAKTAQCKADDVWDRLQKQDNNNNNNKISSNTILISADTIVVLGKEILEKPKSEQHAVEVLKSFSGKTHIVYTAVVIKTQSINHLFVVATDVTFSDLSDEEIISFVKTGIAMDKAGGYSYQDSLSGCFVKEIKGCYYNGYFKFLPSKKKKIYL